MITQKERKLLIMMLILILVATLILAVSIISFVSQPVVEPEETTLQVESQPATEPEETIPETTLIDTETEPIIVETQLVEDEYHVYMITAAESAGECLEGQISVAAVVNNRKENPAFPDTFYGVIYQANQFSPVRNGKIYSQFNSYEELPDKTIEAVKRALEGEDPTEQLLWEEAIRLGLDPEKYAEGGALFFYNPDLCSWQQLAAREKIKVKVRIGNHVFYKVWDT